MKLTIIPIDGTVCEDDVCYSGLQWQGTPANIHALQWFDVSGWIEFNDGAQNENITELPSWTNNAMDAWTVANTPVPPVPPTADQNKSYAITLLYKTDWTTIPDVSDSTKSNPYLSNNNEFVDYRVKIREIAINPVAGNVDWPTPPKAIWVTV
jgi:hypothetical protein